MVCLRSLQKDQLTRLGDNKKYSDNCTVWLGEGLFEFHYFPSWKKGKEKLDKVNSANLLFEL